MMKSTSISSLYVHFMCITIIYLCERFQSRQLFMNNHNFFLFPAIASSCMRTRSLPFASFKCNWVDFSTLPLTFCLNHKCQQIVIESPYLAHLRKKEVYIIAKWRWRARARVCVREKKHHLANILKSTLLRSSFNSLQQHSFNQINQNQT